jgi:hypothetical protein
MQTIKWKPCCWRCLAVQVCQVWHACQAIGFVMACNGIDRF